MKSRDNQCAGLVHLVTEMATEGRKEGEWVSQSRAAPALFGVEKYTNQQDHGPAFITLALVTENSAFAALLLQVFYHQQIKCAHEEYCWCHTDTALRICPLLPGRETKATDASPSFSLRLPQCKRQARSLQVRFSESAPQIQRLRFQLSLFSIKKRAAAYNVPLLLRPSLPNIFFQKKTSAAPEGTAV